jgi:membrane protein involved in colicin uptake
MPQINKTPQTLIKTPEFHTMSKTDQQAYEDSLKQYRDLKNSLDTAELDGFAKAEQHFLPQLEEAKQREEEAKQREEEERRQKEEERRQKEEAMFKLALKMKKYGEPLDEIIRETGLNENDIANL